jgi:hypothetical protein
MKFPFANFPEFLYSLCPLKITLAFEQCSDHSSSLIEIRLAFDKDKAKNLERVFRETLIRAEPNLELECNFEICANNSDIEWSYIEIAPEPAALPSGKIIAVALPLSDIASKVLRQAHSSGNRIAYLLEFKKVEANMDCARRLIPAVAELRSFTTGAEAIEASISNSFESFKVDGWSVRERLCIDSADFLRESVWINNLIRRHLSHIVPFLPAELLPITWDGSPDAEILPTVAARRRPDNYLSAIFETITPSIGASQILSNSITRAKQAKINSTRGDYVFISYAHKNSTDFIQPVTNFLSKFGIKYWYDQDFKTGVIWDEKLEEKIRHAGAIITCVSDDYQASKYCKRELKFADLLHKPILPISMGQCTWEAGLQMMFQELQITSLVSHEGFDKLVQSMRSEAPQCFPDEAPQCFPDKEA